MFESADILEAARAIRPHLPELVGTEAAAIDQQLAALLARAEAGETVDQPILELLRQRDATRKWLTNFLQHQPQVEYLKSWSPLPGERSPVDAAKFVCPQCSYTWYRPRIGLEPPPCPTHGLPLDPA